MEKKKRGRPMRKWFGPKDVTERAMKKENIDPEQAYAENIEKGFNLSFGDLPPHKDGKDKVVRNKAVFRTNIRFLIKDKQMTKAAIAREAGISSDLLRKWSSQGRRRPREAKPDSLDRLRRFFKLDSVDDLWSQDMIEKYKQTEDRAAQMAPYLQSKHWPCIDRFLSLLQSDHFDFLAGLVNTLYEQEIALAGRDNHDKKKKASAGNLAELVRARKRP